MNKNFKIAIMKFLTISLLAFCLISIQAYAIEVESGFDDDFVISNLFDNSSSLVTNFEIHQLDNFTIDLSNPNVEESSTYLLQFDISRSDFLKLGNGGFSFLFPPGFDLSNADVTDIQDSVSQHEYSIYSASVFGQLLTVRVLRSKNDESSDESLDFAVTIRLENVINTNIAGQYALYGLAFDKKLRLIAGPTKSNLFEILGSNGLTIELTPSEDLTVQAGDDINFELTGYDLNGNPVDLENVSWLLKPGSDQIGYFDGSTFKTQKVGQGIIQAVYKSEIIESGLITVIPGELAFIELDISHNQVVGYPLQTRAKIYLLDSFGNFKTDYDLLNNPLELSISEGVISPDLVNDNSLLIEGVIDLLPLEIQYEGQSVTVEMYASSNGIQSNNSVVSFNGFEILDVLNSDGTALFRVLPNQSLEINLFASNNGTQIALDKPKLTAFYNSKPDDFVTTLFDGSYGGIIKNIPIILPPHTGDPSEDIITFQISADYSINGKVLNYFTETEIQIFIEEESKPDLSVANLFPTVVSAGTDAAFEFDLLLEESFGEVLEVIQAEFNLSGNSFNSSSELFFINNQILPGNNKVTSGPIFIPPVLSDNELEASVSITYSDSKGKISQFNSHFDDISVLITSETIVEITNLTIISQNSPRVNINQNFTVEATITNKSDVEIVDLEIQLASNGSSIFDGIRLVELSALESKIISFPVTASSVATINETFILSLVSSNVIQSPIQSPSTFIVIDEPAELTLSYSLIGITNNLIEKGKTFSLLVNLTKTGTSEVSDASYKLLIENDFVSDLPLDGLLKVNEQMIFNITVPDFAVTANFDFSLTAIPIETNTSVNASINQESFNFDITVLSDSPEQATVRIRRVIVEAPNAPRINMNQNFEIICLVENLSEFNIADLRLNLSTNGFSILTAEQLVSIPANDSIEVRYQVTAASEMNDNEVFTLEILSTNVNILNPVDNIASVIIEAPVNIELNHNLFNVHNGVVSRGSKFSIAIELKNLGTAQATSGFFELNTFGTDLGREYQPLGEIAVNEYIIFNFTAPMFDTTFEIEFSLTEIPIDVNTNHPAQINKTKLNFTFTVKSLDGSLFVEANKIGTNLLIPDRVKEMFQIGFTNQGHQDQSRIDVNSLEVYFTDQNNLPLNIEDKIALEETGFYDGNILISTAEISDNRITFTLNNFSISPLATNSLKFKSKFTKAINSPFNVVLDLRTIKAVYAEGPFINQSPEIRTSGDKLILEIKYIFKGKTLENSVVVQNNPFDPRIEPLIFTYELTLVSAVEYRIFTLIGEEVFSKNVASGQSGTIVGENIFEWNGLNNNGLLVLNGVYIVSIKVLSTGEVVRTKVAVVR